MEEALIKKAIARDAHAIEALYDCYAPTLLSVCFRYCGNCDDAEDILHDGFIKIIRKIQTFKVRSDGSLEAWMRRIMELICELPAGYRTVFNLYVFEQYGHKEIAELLQCSENTSKSQLSKARALLRKKMNQLVNVKTAPTYEKA